MKNNKAKNQPKKPQGKNKQKIKEAVPLTLSFGRLDIIYKIEFTEQDLLKPEDQQSENDKYYDITSFNSIKDLSFMKDKKNIYDKIQLIPNNSTLEQLIIATKISKKKMHVDYIGYGRPKFEGDDEFFNEIFEYVNEKNHIDINQNPLIESGPYTFTFEFTYKKKTHSFSMGTPAEKVEGNESGGNNDKDQEDYEPNEYMKQGKIPKFTRKDSILCNLKPRYVRYCSFYLNYDELNYMSGDFEKKDLIEFIYFLKKKGCKIFLNFYQPKEEEEKKEEEEVNNNKDNEIAGESYDTSGKANPNKKTEKKEEEEEEEEEGESKEEREMKNLNNLYYLTDLYFFESKQAIKEFDNHYQFFRDDKQIKKSINKQKLIDYFIKGIASGLKDEVDGDKVGFFLDDFIKYTIVRAAKKTAQKYEFDIQLYPKINHSNMKLVDEYKKIIKKNINHYISIFITFIICGVTSTGSNSDEVIVGAFLNALEIIKRKLECEKNKIDISDKELMKYKMSEKDLADRIKELCRGSQENGFVLDCTNKEKSELKEYIPLYDYHLAYYFTSEETKKQLKQQGFINEKGFIMYDPVHRKRMRPDINKKKVKISKEEEQKKKESKIENNIKKIDVGSRMKDKEIDASIINNDKNLVTIKKLPKSNLGIFKRKEKSKKRREKTEKGNDNSANSGSSSDSAAEKEIIVENSEQQSSPNKSEEVQ